MQFVQLPECGPFWAIAEHSVRSESEQQAFETKNLAGIWR